VSRCRYCEAETAPGKLSCEVCARGEARGRQARDWQVPIDQCPWASGRADMVEVYGDPRDFHGLTTCAWCHGWAERELGLYREACRRGTA
jgi:hypothetical protein